MSFWDVYSFPLIHMSVLVPRQCCFDYYSFVVLSEIWEGYAFNFVIFPQDCSAIMGLLWFQSLGLFVLVLWKSVMSILIGFTLNLQIALGSTAILTILILPIQEHGLSCHFFKSSSVSFISVAYFLRYRSFTSLLRFYLPKCLFFFWVFFCLFVCFGFFCLFFYLIFFFSLFFFFYYINKCHIFLCSCLFILWCFIDNIKKCNRFLCLSLLSCYLAEFIYSNSFCVESLGFSL